VLGRRSCSAMTSETGDWCESLLLDSEMQDHGGIIRTGCWKYDRGP